MSHNHGNRSATVGSPAFVYRQARAYSDARLAEVADQVNALRSVREDENVRAIRRNRNRCLTLLVTVVAEILLPIFLLPALTFIPPALKNQAMILLITIPDALITVYALIRKY